MDGWCEFIGVILGCILVCLLIAFGFFAAVVAIKLALSLF